MSTSDPSEARTRRLVEDADDLGTLRASGLDGGEKKRKKAGIMSLKGWKKLEMKSRMKGGSGSDGIKVIGAGFGRTGTKSLQSALGILGYSTYHMANVFEDGPPEMKKWGNLFQQKQAQNWGLESKEVCGTLEEWEDLLGDFDATTDCPASLFYEDLQHHYPNAKVVLTVRPPEKFAMSIQRTIAVHFCDRRIYFAFAFLRAVLPKFRCWAGDVLDPLWEGFGKLGGLEIPVEEVIPNSALVEKCFAQFNERVIRTIPKERLLIFEVKQGWEPLCKFLDVPIPDQPFPKENDSEEMQKRIADLCSFSYFLLTGLVALLALLFGLLLKGWQATRI